MNGIYSTNAYQMGAAQIGGQFGDAVSAKEKAIAEQEIRKMRGSLTKWLKFRNLLAAPPQTVSPLEMSPTEKRLGKRLYVLLSEMFDPQQLPSENEPIKLAQIAVAGKLPSESMKPTAQGMAWLWPAVAVVGLVLLTVVIKIKTDADDAADQREHQAIMAGKATDSGFWLKMAGIGIVAWLLWEKFGLKKTFSKSASLVE